ncbi:MAG: alpha-mannosidase [Ignavibacteriaceae bacterium]
MKAIGYFFIFILFQSMLLAQTNVDRLAFQLDSLSSSYDNWKISGNLSDKNTVFKGNPYDINFDDSSWSTLTIGENNYDDSCWLRKEIILPDKILGEQVQGKITLLLSVDDYGYLWVNGESKGYFPWDGDFVLTENGKPGEKFMIAIKAINTGGPLRLLRAKLQTESSVSTQEMIKDFILSMKVGQKLLSFDTYQTNSSLKVDPHIDKSTIDRNEKISLNDLLQKLAGEVDVDALKNGDFRKFKESLAKVRSQLIPIKNFVKKFTLFFDSNAHIDAAWLWRSKETKFVCRNTFASVLHIMDVKPEFTYTQSAAQYFKWMQDLYPDVFQGIKDRIKDGRWEVVGGMWIEPDCNLPSGESWDRQLLYAKSYFQKNLGVDVKLGWNPDSFGYNWNMPMFYKNAGIDAFITQKIGWNETDVFPYRVFWWESPDGSRILSYFPFDYVNTITQSYELVDWLRQFEANTGFKKFMILFGVGDHGGGPTIDMIDRIEHLKTLDIYPNIEYGTATNYINWLKSQDLSKLPVWDSELYLEYHQGTFTSHSNIKKYNRRSENLLTETEKFLSIATIFGGKYDASDIDDAWRYTMFNQFHDILPGSGIREVYIDAIGKYKKVKEIGDFVLGNALDEINKNINTSGIKNGRPLTVFNSLAWNRTDVVKFELPKGDMNKYKILDGKMKEIPSQMIKKDRFINEIMFVAEDVPSLGYKTYILEKGNPSNENTSLKTSIGKIENQYFTVNIDTVTGWVSGIFDKRNNKEILSGEGNMLQLLEDKPKFYDAWNIGFTGVVFPSQFRKAEVIETGPVRTVVRLYRDYLKPGVQKDYPTKNFPSSFFTQDVILYNGIDRIDFKTDIDWWEAHTMLKVAFPLAFTDTVATYEIPYGTIQRSTQNITSWQKAQFEVPAEKWADVTNNDYGVSLLNNSKYGYDIKGNLMRLSLLRSPKSPDPTTDMGKHSIDYALYPHTGSWKDANSVRKGYEYNQPLIAELNSVHNGKLPKEKSFIKLVGDNVVLTSVKKALNSDAWVIQWYESKGKNTETTLTLPKTPKKVVESNFIEIDGKPIKFVGNEVKVNTKKYSVQTIKVYY